MYQVAFLAATSWLTIDLAGSIGETVKELSKFFIQSALLDSQRSLRLLWLWLRLCSGTRCYWSCVSE